jgi:hypothetical protein
MVTQRKIKDIRNDLEGARVAAPTRDFATGGKISFPLESVADIRVQTGTINRRTALFIDKSGCGEYSVPVGRRIVSVMSALATSSLYTYAFDTLAYPLESTRNGTQGCADGFVRLAGGNGTAIGAPLEAMRLKGQVVEQIVIITDGRENNAPCFVDVFEDYRRHLGVQPTVVIVRVGEFDPWFEQRLRENHVDVRALVFDGPGSLSRLIGLLARPSRLDRLIDRIEAPSW